VEITQSTKIYSDVIYVDKLDEISAQSSLLKTTIIEEKVGKRTLPNTKEYMGIDAEKRATKKLKMEEVPIQQLALIGNTKQVIGTTMPSSEHEVNTSESGKNISDPAKPKPLALII